MCWWQAPDILVQCLLLIGDSTCQILRYHTFIRPAPDRRILQYLMLLGTKPKGAIINVVVERLDPEKIPRAEQLAFPPIPDRKREISDDVFRTLLAPDNIRLQHQLGVSVVVQPRAACLQRRFQLTSIVDTAVEHQTQVAGLVA